jgi:hypothetical protein
VTRAYTIAPDNRSITCRRCGLTSHNPNDVAQRYCGGCHVFHDNILTVWVIYRHPKDFPKSWVLRGQDACADGGIKPHAACHVASSLDNARSGLPPGLVNIGRQPEDDAAIYECWI